MVQLTEEAKEAIIKKAKDKVEKEIKIYENFPAPDPEDIVRYTFKEMTPDLKEEFEEIK